MIRKTIMIVLITAAMGTVVVGALSFIQPVAVQRHGWHACCLVRVVEGDATIVLGRDVRLSHQSWLDRLPWSGVGRYGVIQSTIEPAYGRSGGRRTDVFRLPVWLYVLMFSAYPTTALLHARLCRYRRGKRGLCVKCGYNLTGLPSLRCPECGTRIEQL